MDDPVVAPEVLAKPLDYGIFSELCNFCSPCAYSIPFFGTFVPHPNPKKVGINPKKS